MTLLMEQCDPAVVPFIQSAFYHVLQSAQEVGSTHGRCKKAWESWLEEVDTTCGIIAEEMVEKEFQDRRPLSPVSQIRGHLWSPSPAGSAPEFEKEGDRTETEDGSPMDTD